MKPHIWKAPVLDSMLCCHHLEILNDLIFELEFWDGGTERYPCSVSFPATPYAYKYSFSDAR